MTRERPDCRNAMVSPEFFISSRMISDGIFTTPPPPLVVSDAGLLLLLWLVGNPTAELSLILGGTGVRRRKNE
jgi:hypothetical protein